MKRTFRKILSLLLVVTLVFGTVAFGFADVDWSEINWHDFAIKAEAAETFTEGYYTYTLDENGNATITDFTNDTAYSVTIPSKLDGHPVTVIGGEAFSGSSIHSVTIPEGVTDICNYAFYLCSALTSAEISDSVTSIGYRAFYNCSKLSSITIGKNVTEIEHEAFALCNSLNTVYYSGTPNQWNDIKIVTGNSNLDIVKIYECRSEKPYYLPGVCGENLTWILYTDGELVISGTGAMTNWSDTTKAPWYDNRSEIKTVTIESGATRIGDYAFYKCWVKNVTIPYTVAGIGNYAFGDCTGLKGLVIGSKVRTIGNHAFDYCTNLTTITVPESLSYVGDNAFAYCKSIKSANYPGTHEQWKEVYVGNNNYYLESNIIDVNSERPCYAPGTYGDNIVWKLYLDGELIINGTGIIENLSGVEPWNSKRDLIKTLTIKNGITGIANDVYFGYNLTSVSFGNTVTSIGNFLHLYDVTDISVDPLNTVYSNDENGVLFNKDKTILVKYPAGNERTSYVIPDGTKTIDYSAFKSCMLNEITLPDSVTNISNYAFAYSSLRKIRMSENIQRIGYHAFDDIRYLTTFYPGTKEQWKSVTIGEGNEPLTEDFIFECYSERPYYLSGYCGESLTYKLYTDGELVIEGFGDMFNYKVDYDSFALANSPWGDKGDKVKKITISDGVNSIGNYSFADCCNEDMFIYIPGSVTRIGEYAFCCNPKFCQTIMDVYYGDNKSEWNEILVGENNQHLEAATVHYNYDPADVPPITQPSEPSTTNPNVENTTDSVVTKPSTEPTKPVESPTAKPATTKPVTTRPVVTEPSTTKPVEVPTTRPTETKPSAEPTKPIETEPSTTKLDVENTTKPVITEPSTVPATQPTAEQKKLFKIRKPSQTEIKYGDSIILHADFESKIPEGAKVIWSTDNDNFKIVETTSSGETCIVTPNANGNTVFTATLVDSDGNAIESDTQTMTSKAGFFQKIIAFFKKLFGLTKVIPEAIKY